MATTSANTARRGSTCRSGCSSAASSARFPNIIPRPTISISSGPSIWRSYRLITDAIDVIEGNAIYLNTLPKCEPQLGKRGLYGAIGGDKDAAAANMAMLWILNLSDGDAFAARHRRAGKAAVRGRSEDGEICWSDHGLLEAVAP